jgi:hypothetical protein
MAIRFVDGSTGNDANDGLDNTGVGLATATWTESTFTLTQAGHGYTFATGDVIYISGGTDVVVGLYEVASSTANDIVLVETSTLPNVGDASNLATGDLATGDITSSGGPDLTIQAALDVLAAGDHIYVRSGTSYNEALTTTTAGASNEVVVLEGYTTTLGDGGLAINDGTTGSLAEGWTPISGSNFYVWKNFRFTNFTGTCFGNNLGDYIQLYRVEADNGGSGGIELDDKCMVLLCNAHDNTGDGISITSFGSIHMCISHSNTGNGVEATGSMAVNDCLIYNNTGNGINWIGTDGSSSFCNSTIVASAASGSTGMSLGISNVANRIVCVNNTISGYSGTGGKGIDTPAHGERSLIFNNNVFDCEKAYDNSGDLGGGTTGDPSFVNAGSRDYTPSGGSPLIAAGLDTFGAPGAPTLTTQTATVGSLLRATVSGGGGGLLIHPGTSGGARA